MYTDASKERLSKFITVFLEGTFVDVPAFSFLKENHPNFISFESLNITLHTVCPSFVCRLGGGFQYHIY